MSIIKEFREFAVKGNAVGMAIGIVIGAAFGNITNSLVNDVIMPPLGYLTGGVEFKHLSIVLKAATPGAPEVAIRYGQFINTVVNFFIIAGSIFLVLKFINSLSRKKQ
ncbi:large-conductance mechanosensitive channel protein MscL [Candidatus Omnitrophota bacterium]